jgi:DNA-binding response OmpR family regulator
LDPTEQAAASVGVLIVDDDIASQRALKGVLDAESWRIRVVTRTPDAMAELATGVWNLVIANATVAQAGGPLFAVLKELAQSEPASQLHQPEGPRQKRLSVLFLVSALQAKEVQTALEREGLSYLQKPYHLHDLLEKVSELLMQSGAITEPIRGISGFAARKRRRDPRTAHNTRRAMFASREDYQMTEEEMADFEREEEDDRKKREKELKEIKERGTSS